MGTTKKQLTITARLILGFGLILAALVALTVIAIGRVEMVRARLDNIIDVNGVKERYAINFRGSVHDRSIAVRDVTLVSPQRTAHRSSITFIQLAGEYDESAEARSRRFMPNARTSPPRSGRSMRGSTPRRRAACR